VYKQPRLRVNIRIIHAFSYHLRGSRAIRCEQPRFTSIYFVDGKYLEARWQGVRYTLTPLNIPRYRFFTYTHHPHTFVPHVTPVLPTLVLFGGGGGGLGIVVVIRRYVVGLSVVGGVGVGLFVGG
jgi:hypothetical protein